MRINRLGKAVATAAACAMLSLAAHAQAPPDDGLTTFRATDGARLVYRVAGKGSPCIFIHGGPGQGSESFRQMGGDRLEAFARVLYLDQRGSGHSPDADDYRLSRVVDDVEEARRHAGLGDVCIIAHSFGGIAAVNYAKRYPAHVTSLILSNVTLHFLSNDTLRMQIGMLNSLLPTPVAMPPESATIEDLFRARAEARSQVNATGRGYLQFTADDSTLRRMMAIDNGYERSQGYGNAVMSRAPRYSEYFDDYVPLTKHIDVPALILAGKRDYVVGPEHHRSFLFPNSTTVVLDCGHMPYSDRSDEFASVIEHFLDELKATSNRAGAKARFHPDGPISTRLQSRN